MYFTAKLKKMFKLLGVTIDKYPAGDLMRRKMLFEYYNINLVFDVGANTGQYVDLLKRLGLKARFVSFEPLSDAFYILEKKSRDDENWHSYRNGVGEENFKSYINVSYNSVSSSFLDMLPIHERLDSTSKYFKKELVEVITVDSIFKKFYRENDNVLLKIDTQGYEKRVLRGAENSLEKIRAIQLEMCITPTYNGETNFVNIIRYLSGFDFKLYSLEPGYYNKKTGQLYQCDGIFIKSDRGDIYN